MTPSEEAVKLFRQRYSANQSLVIKSHQTSPTLTAVLVTLISHLILVSRAWCDRGPWAADCEETVEDDHMLLYAACPNPVLENYKLV